MLSVRFGSQLKTLLRGETALVPYREGDTVHRVLEKAEYTVGLPFLHKVVQGDGSLRLGVVICVNEDDILNLNGLKTVVVDEDVVTLRVSGG